MSNILEGAHLITQGEVNKFLLATLLCGLIG
ncbi:MAG: MgtC/SapB family protein, partial [Pedobacter sp.]